MSYVCLATERFDELVEFYRDRLGFPVVSDWNRPGGRGARLDLSGMMLELLDATREREPFHLEPPSDRFHLVVEVADVDDVHRRLMLEMDPPMSVSWGARILSLKDPDGTRLSFVQWLESEQRR